MADTKKLSQILTETWGSIVSKVFTEQELASPAYTTKAPEYFRKYGSPALLTYVRQGGSLPEHDLARSVTGIVKNLNPASYDDKKTYTTINKILNNIDGIHRTPPIDLIAADEKYLGRVFDRLIKPHLSDDKKENEAVKNDFIDYMHQEKLSGNNTFTSKPLENIGLEFAKTSLYKKNVEDDCVGSNISKSGLLTASNSLIMAFNFTREFGVDLTRKGLEKERDELRGNLEEIYDEVVAELNPPTAAQGVKAEGLPKKAASKKK